MTPHADPRTGAPTRRLWLPPLLAGGLFAVLFIWLSSFEIAGERYFTLFDDAMISMRYARNLAEGSGLVWNPGEAPVEGYTNFLWTLWMAALHLAGVGEARVSLLVMLSGLAILLANLGLVWRIARLLAPDAPGVARLALWLTAFAYPLIYWTLRGMEVGLLALLTSAAAYLALRLERRFRPADLALLAGVCGLGLLTRTDFAVTCAAVAAYLLLAVRRPRLRLVLGLVLVAAVLGTLAAHTAFRLAYYGEPLPNTYYLKVEGVGLATRLVRGLGALAAVNVAYLALTLALAAGAVLAPRGLHAGRRLLGLVFAAQCAYSVYVGGDAWEWFLYPNRYLTPGLPLLLVLAALAIDRRTGLAAPRVVVGVLAGSFLAGAGLALAMAGGLLAAFDVPSVPLETLGQVGLVAAAYWLGARALGRPAARGGTAVLRALFGGRAAIALLVLTANATPFLNWAVFNGFHVLDDAEAVRYGLALRRVTAPDASVALAWAGAPAYFSQRVAVDLLGKSDRVIAHEPPRTDWFKPGHNKWDYAYSVGVLRPTVVAQLGQSTEADRAAIEAAGYEEVGPSIYVVRASGQLDRPALQALVCERHWNMDLGHSRATTWRDWCPD